MDKQTYKIKPPSFLVKKPWYENTIGLTKEFSHLYATKLVYSIPKVIRSTISRHKKFLHYSSILKVNKINKQNDLLFKKTSFNVKNTLNTNTVSNYHNKYKDHKNKIDEIADIELKRLKYRKILKTLYLTKPKHIMVFIKTTT